MSGSEHSTDPRDTGELGLQDGESGTLGGTVIRVAQPIDAASLAVLCGQLGYPATAEQVQARLAPILADESHVVLVAEGPHGSLVGWVEIYGRRLLVEDLHAELGGLVVAEDSRCQRVGRRLIDRAEAWARSRGYEFLLVRSNVIREQAHHFYRQIGYQEIKRQATFQKRLRESSEAPRVSGLAA